MLMKRNIFAIFFALVMCISALWAGDTAVFVDLGFSPDGRIFMFGQYGVQSGNLRPWADIFVVDVAANNFVRNGRISHVHNRAINAGQDGSGVFHRLIAENAALANRHNVDFVNQGLPLYISRNENPPRNGEVIEFRNFNTGTSYRAELVPTITGSGQNTRSSFIIRLESRTAGGQVRTYTVGTPQVVRPLIASYNIRRVLIDSTGRSMIFVIEMRRVAGASFDIRYMVEAVRL